MSAREQCLGQIRRQLERSVGSFELPEGPTPGGPGELNAGQRLQRFCENLQASGGTLHRVPEAEAAGRRFAELATELELQRVARSDSALLAPLVSACTGLEWLVAGAFPTTSSERAPLFNSQAGVSAAQLAIAETGTLLLDSSVERHRLVSLVPPVHIVLLRARDIVADLGTALDHYGDRGLPPTLTLITGPSRTADIELELVVGVHGPRELHVLLVEGSA
jgi:L-lactate utilization protein LutC